MSFRCEACKEPQAPLAKPVVVPVEFRAKTYRGASKDVPGWEVAREARLCEACAGDVRPSVESVVNGQLSGTELEVVLTALKTVGGPPSLR